jgi:hypothetical protein
MGRDLACEIGVDASVFDPRAHSSKPSHQRCPF